MGRGGRGGGGGGGSSAERAGQPVRLLAGQVLQASSPVLSQLAPSPPQEGTAPELLYNRFTSKDRTSILALVLKEKVEFLGLLRKS